MCMRVDICMRSNKAHTVQNPYLSQSTNGQANRQSRRQTLPLVVPEVIKQIKQTDQCSETTTATGFHSSRGQTTTDIVSAC